MYISSMLVGTVVNSCRVSLLPYHPGGLLSVVSYLWITLRVCKFNARWYGGKEQSCEFVTIPSLCSFARDFVCHFYNELNETNYKPQLMTGQGCSQGFIIITHAQE